MSPSRTQDLRGALRREREENRCGMLKRNPAGLASGMRSICVCCLPCQGSLLANPNPCRHLRNASRAGSPLTGLHREGGRGGLLGAGWVLWAQHNAKREHNPKQGLHKDYVHISSLYRTFWCFPLRNWGTLWWAQVGAPWAAPCTSCRLGAPAQPRSQFLHYSTFK